MNTETLGWIILVVFCLGLIWLGIKEFDRWLDEFMDWDEKCK